MLAPHVWVNVARVMSEVVIVIQRVPTMATAVQIITSCVTVAAVEAARVNAARVMSVVVIVI